MHGKYHSRVITGEQRVISPFYRTNPTVADIATISIGGNDIGFYNILTSCVLRFGGYWAGDCDTEVAKAYERLASPDLSANITSVLTEIIKKNGNTAFKIYMTGYVTFFNQTTPLCDDSSFRIWDPHYDKTHEEKGQPWLTKALRSQLNGVVVALNKLLSEVADSVNARYANTPRVVFVNPNRAFVGHRWCEDGVYEPDNDRPDTWLFLSSTPDNGLPDNPRSAAESYKQEQSQLTAGPSFSLPDPTACRGSLNKLNSVVCNDWYGKSSILEWHYVALATDYQITSENMLCDISIAASDSSSFEHQIMQEQNSRIQKDNFTELRIPWYVPTKLAKTFHPKTLGQQAFAEEIMAVW